MEHLDIDDADSMFEAASEMNIEEVPEKAQLKIDQLQDTVTKLNIEIKDKNGKILDLMNEIEEVKIQVYARDKSIELQQSQIDELLEELRESKGLENDVKILVQKKMAIEEENQRLRDELEQQLIQGMSGATDDAQQDLVLINQGLQSEIKRLQEQLLEEKNIRQKELGRMRREVDEAKKEYESHKYQAMTKDREIEKAKIDAVKKQDEAIQRLQQMEQKMEMERQKHEEQVAQNQEAISLEKQTRMQIEKELKKQFDKELADLQKIKLANQKLQNEN